MATEAQNAQTTDNVKEKGPSPFLRGKDIALWLHPATDVSPEFIDGFAMLDERRVNVHAFFNKAKDTGRAFLGLTHKVDGEWKTLGFGNAINSSKESKPVYFDTVAFNLGDKTLFANVTKAAAADELRQKIGFTSPLVERPKKEAESSSPAEEAGETADAAPAAMPRPRG